MYGSAVDRYRNQAPLALKNMGLTLYLVFGINKPLSVRCEHKPQPRSVTKYLPEILIFVEKSLQNQPDSSGVSCSGVCLSQLKPRRSHWSDEFLILGI
jgi:hypothetical protein